MKINPMAAQLTATAHTKKAEEGRGPATFQDALKNNTTRAKDTTPVDDVVSIQALQPEGLKGDLNGDGAVNEADLNALLEGWGQNTSDLSLNDRVVAGDLDMNGKVDGADLGMLLANWTVEAPAEAAQAVAVDETAPGAADAPQFESAEWHEDVNTLFRDPPASAAVAQFESAEWDENIHAISRQPASENVAQFEEGEVKQDISTYFRDNHGNTINAELTLNKLLKDLLS